MKTSSAGGFTLIELLVVIIVLSLLATLAVSTFSRVTVCRRHREARDTLDEMLKANQVVRMETGQFTRDMSMLPILDPSVNGPIVYDILPTDPTGPFIATATLQRGNDTYTTRLEYTPGTYDNSPVRCSNEINWPCPGLIADCGG